MKRALFPFLALTAISLAVGCGGKGGGGTFVPGATPAPHVGATTVPVGASATTVSISDGSGNTTSFTMPKAVGGVTANMTIAMSTPLPPGVSVPANHRQPKQQIIGANVSALEYITVVMDGNLGITMAPTVTFGLASPIPGSAQTYLLLWDPARSSQQGWIVLLGPGTVGNPRTLVTFNGVPTGQSYTTGNAYVYALVTTSAAVPTATPAPTPTPVSQPQATTMPAYCANFATAPPAPNLGPGRPQPVIFNDDSGLNGDVVFYVTDTGQNESGSPAIAGATTYARALNEHGQWATPNPLPAYTTSGALKLTPIQPFPLKCFPGSIGVNGVPKYSGRQFKIPVAVSGLMYIAYAPSPAPNSTAIPDPFAGKFGFVGTPTGARYGIQAPSVDWFASSFVQTPWDVIEYCLNVSGCVMDLTQENRIGLPIELSPGGNPVVGFGPAAYEQVLSDLQQTQTYDVLPTWIQWGPTTALARVMAPGSAGDYGFPQDWWYNNSNYMRGNPKAPLGDQTQATYYSSNYSAQGQGYVGYLLQEYHAHPQTYTIHNTTSAKTPTTNDVYCATSDGTSTFIFTEVGSVSRPTPNPCAAAPAPTPMPGGNVFDMSAWSFVEGNPMQSNPGPPTGYCQTAIFNMAASGAGQLAEIPKPITKGGYSDFYLWKAAMVDIARGMALQDVVHPASTWNTGAGPAFSSYFKDPVYDEWAKILHKDMYANKAYALQYDELGGLSTSFTPDVSGKTTLGITVQHIPTGGSPVLPSSLSAPWPVPPSPLPCPTPTP